MKVNKGTLIVLGATLLLNTSIAYSKSKPWRANNHSDQDIKVFWTAAGCSGVKPLCYSHDEGNNNSNGLGNVNFVCKTKILQPGEKSEYKFPDGTSNREKGACTVDKKGYTSWTERRKRNGIKVDGDRVIWYAD
ncbi:MAG: hypothetical protein V2J55_20225 [Candidatus Competibacteraceae bacterium]|jgi:hypothetical protein|nr:hypothetical protein [Candidatus Competibacteraceae bacterium]